MSTETKHSVDREQRQLVVYLATPSLPEWVYIKASSDVSCFDIHNGYRPSSSWKIYKYVFHICHCFNNHHHHHPRRKAGDVWCIPPVWNLRAVIWFHFAISSLVLLPSPVTLSVLSFSACWAFLLNFFQKILQYFSLRDRLFCMVPV